MDWFDKVVFTAAYIVIVMILSIMADKILGGWWGFAVNVCAGAVYGFGFVPMMQRHQP